MALTRDNMLHLCKLAKILPSVEEQDMYGSQCDKIITYMDQLGEVDTTHIEPLYSPVLHQSAFREDAIERHISKEEILANAPLTDGDYFIVPKIVG